MAVRGAKIPRADSRHRCARAVEEDRQLCETENGFDLSWQLLDVASQSVRSGGSIGVSSLDLIAVQTEISNEVFATLQGMGAAEGIESVQGGPGTGAARGTQRGIRTSKHVAAIINRERCCAAKPYL